MFYVVMILIREHHMPFVERFMAREVSCLVTDRQTDRQTHTSITVTFAVHARRGLIREHHMPFVAVV